MTDKKIITTGEVYGLYPNLHNKKQNEMSGKEEFSMILVIPKAEEETVKEIQEEVKQLFDSKGWKTFDNPKNPLKDGELQLTTSMSKNEKRINFYKDKFWMRTKTQFKPRLINIAGGSVSEDDISFGGMFKVKLSFYPYQVPGNQGVGANLGDTLWLGKNESLNNVFKPDESYEKPVLSVESFGIQKQEDDIPF